MNMNLSFKGLPPFLQKTNIYETNYKGVAEIIKDAGEKAGVQVNVTAPKVFDANKEMFDGNGNVADTNETRQLLDCYAQLIPKGKILTCADLRDAVANSYKRRIQEDPYNKPRNIDLITL